MQQKTLDFHVSEQHIAAPCYTVVADSRHYLYARFYFDAAWDSLEKIAVFKGSDGMAYQVLLEQDTCLIPHEVIVPSHFFVSVFGGDRLTADTAAVKVLASGFADGEPPTAPTPDLYAQFLSEVGGVREETLAAAGSAKEDATASLRSAVEAEQYAMVAMASASAADENAKTATQAAEILATAADTVTRAEAAADRVDETLEKVATLDENGTVPLSQLPDSVKSGVDVEGLLKGEGNGVVVAAMPDVDYVTPDALNGKMDKIGHYGMVCGDGAGGLRAADPTYDYVAPEALPALRAEILLAAHPVGSVYVSRDATDPATLFGGTWVRIKDRFIWGIGDTDTVGATGGAKTHTLADGELPFSHIWMSSNTPATTGDNTGPYYTVAGVKTGPSKQAFSLMPPYIGMYMWERTA